MYEMYHIFTSEKLLPEKWQDYVLRSVGRRNATKEILLFSFIWHPIEWSPWSSSSAVPVYLHYVRLGTRNNFSCLRQQNFHHRSVFCPYRIPVEIDAVISLPTNSKKMNFPYRNNASSRMHVSAVSSALFSPGTLVLCYFCVRMFNTTS